MEENLPALSLGEASFEENVFDVLNTLPQPIQDFLTGPERDAVTIKISQKYNLHSDQAGKFQKAFLFMLMGIFSPEEFVSDLQQAGITPEIVKALANDVNEMVFKPLREKERIGNVEKPSTATPIPAQPVAASQPIETLVSTTERTPAPYAGARPQPLTPFNLPGTNANPDDLFRTSTRTVPPIQMPIPIPQVPVAPPQPVFRAQPVTPAPAHMPVEKVSIPAQPVRAQREEALGGTLRTMATDMLAVNEHRDPEPVQYKGTVFTPPMLMEKIPELIPLPRKTSTPVPTPVPHQTSTPPSIRPVVRPMVTPSPSNDLIKEYSSDPYREPV